MLRDWRKLAGAGADHVADRLRSEGLSADGFADTDWLPAATYLRLHDLLAEELCGGDRAALAELWLGRVGGQVGAVARMAARAYGWPRAAGHAGEAWGHAWQAPVPQFSWVGGVLQAEFAGHSLFAVPTFRLLTALQAKLAAEVFSGRAASVRAEELAGGWRLTVQV